ncbi:hypothetical protein JCGZ_03939 [Jatropha curcas]|uniref:Uncharacterized protein n=1 Tax=Jatropha curcas TaxID=180498 RepID=A0A067KXX2_JATCU|nr:hypothetical protein JCGZ_03939 [Jatropha curcas]
MHSMEMVMFIMLFCAVRSYQSSILCIKSKTWKEGGRSYHFIRPLRFAEYEKKALENLKPKLKANTVKEIAFARSNRWLHKKRATRSKKQNDKSKAKSILFTWVVTHNQGVVLGPKAASSDIYVNNYLYRESSSAVTLTVSQTTCRILYSKESRS